MSRTQDVFWGSAWYFFGAVLAAGVAYLTKLVLVRTLTVEEYGLFFAVFTFVSFFTVFKSLGLSKGLVRFSAQYRSSHRKLASIVYGSTLVQFVSALLAVGAMWALSGWLATHYFASQEAVWLLRVVSLYLPLSVLFSNTRALLNGLKMNRWLAAAEPLKNTAVFVVTVIALLLGARIWAPAWGYLLAQVIVFIVLGTVLLTHTRFWKAKPTRFVAENKKLLLFSLPLTLTVVGAAFISYFDTLMLTYFDTVVEVGVYNIVYPSAMLLAMLGTAIGAVMLPVVTELYSKKKHREITRAHTTIYTFVFVLLIPLAYAAILVSEELIRIFFGADYVLGAAAFSVLLIGALFKTISTINYQTLIGLGQSKRVMHVFLFGAGLNTVLNLVLIPLYSLTGAAIASAASFLCMMLLSQHYAVVKLRLPYKKMALVGLCALSVPASMYLFIGVVGGILGAILGGLIGGGVYLALVLLLRITSVREIWGLVR